MGFYPYNPSLGQTMQSDGVQNPDQAFIAHVQVPASAAVVASTTGVLAAQASTGTTLTITTGFTQPAYPRNITATAGGTATDIKAIQVTVTGTDMNGAVISETLPAFTVDTAGTVTGAKIFRTITQVSIPTHDGNAATTAIGFGSKFGLPHKLTHNTVLVAYLNNVREATLPTVTVSASALESNGFTLNSTPNGSVIDIYYLV